MLDGLPLFESRDAALQALEISREGYLTVARRAADRIISEKGSVCIDDIRREVPPPDNVDPRVLGAVFNRSRYKLLSYKQGQACGRENYHSRKVGVFTWADAETFPLTHDPLTGAPV